METVSLQSVEIVESSLVFGDIFRGPLRQVCLGYEHPRFPICINPSLVDSREPHGLGHLARQTLITNLLRCIGVGVKKDRVVWPRLSPELLAKRIELVSERIRDSFADRYAPP